MLESIHKQARFFVALGYSRDRTIAQLQSGFPGQDAEAAYIAALDQWEKSESELMEQVDRDEAAIASEHDLSKSIHEGE